MTDDVIASLGWVLAEHSRCLRAQDVARQWRETAHLTQNSHHEATADICRQIATEMFARLNTVQQQLRNQLQENRLEAREERKTLYQQSMTRLEQSYELLRSAAAQLAKPVFALPFDRPAPAPPADKAAC